MSRIHTSRAVVAAGALAGAMAVVPAVSASADTSAGTVTRIAGADRYEASANISQANFGAGLGGTIYIASGEVYTDALSGAPVAGKNNRPVLLTRSDELPAVVADEIERLQPDEIVVFGGTATITGAVMNALRKLTDGDVTRIAAPTRYSASAKISSLNFDVGPATTFVASGEIFTDALSGAPVAGKTPGPLLLIESDNVPGVVKKELTRLESKRIIVLGGENTIDQDTYAFLTRYTTGAVERWAGPDRFSTSAYISAQSYAAGVDTVYVASGRVFADALSGAPVAGRQNVPVLLVDTDAIPSSVGAELDRLNPTNIVVLGGPASVSPAVETQLASYLAD